MKIKSNNIKYNKMNISVLMPIHEFNDEISELMVKGIKSINLQEKINEFPLVCIVYAEKIEKEINEWIEKYSETFNNLKFKLIKNSENYNFQSQINLGAANIETEYFSILEFDDEYSNTYFYNGLKYIKAYPKNDVFLYTLIEVNEKNEAVKLTNEIVWSQQMVGENGEIGHLNMNVLKQYSDIKLSGSLIKKDEFLDLGGFKSKIEISFMYEFLLRAMNNACSVFVIPKIGYKHFSNRKDSLSFNILNNMSVTERKFWFDIAVKESNFMNDRDIDKSKLNVVKQ